MSNPLFACFIVSHWPQQIIKDDLWRECRSWAYVKEFFQVHTMLWQSLTTLYWNLFRTTPITPAMWNFVLFHATLRHILYSSRNVHRAYEDLHAKRLIRNKKNMKVRKLTTQSNFQDHTQDFPDYKILLRPRVQKSHCSTAVSQRKVS